MEDPIIKLKKRILKILEKAEKTNHPAEAASLGAKARAMMEEHQLNMVDLDQSKDPMGRTMVFSPGLNREYTILGTATAGFFGCSMIYQKVTIFIKFYLAEIGILTFQ